MNTNRNLTHSVMLSRAREANRSQTLNSTPLIPAPFPTTAQPHNLQIAPAKEPVKRQLSFTLISFVLAMLFLIQISPVIRYYHKALPTVVQPQPKKWHTAITVVAFSVSFVWCWRQHLIKESAPSPGCNLKWQQSSSVQMAQLSFWTC